MACHLAWNRRTLLTASSLGFCGLALPQVGAARTRQRAKSVILIWLTGGPSHVDLWDMKPQAPSDYRGEFQSIATSAPEIRLGELLPHVAQQAHQLAIVSATTVVASRSSESSMYSDAPCAWSMAPGP